MPSFNASHFFTMQVVRSLLVSLAHHENYHAMFNHFVRQNPLILEEKEGGFLGLLDYNNKLNWIGKKLTILKYVSVIYMYMYICIYVYTCEMDNAQGVCKKRFCCC